jgi:hypothetical protein
VVAEPSYIFFGASGSGYNSINQDCHPQPYLWRRSCHP